MKININIRPASVGALAYIVAEYGAKLWDLNGTEEFLWAVGSVLVLTAINIMGVTLGKNTQNLLTAAKLAGLVLIVVVGFGWGNSQTPLAGHHFHGEEGWFATAMIRHMVPSSWSERHLGSVVDVRTSTETDGFLGYVADGSLVRDDTRT